MVQCLTIDKPDLAAFIALEQDAAFFPSESTPPPILIGTPAAQTTLESRSEQTFLI